MANKNLAGSTPNFGPQEVARPFGSVDHREIEDPTYLRAAPIRRYRSETSDSFDVEADEELDEVLAAFGAAKRVPQTPSRQIMAQAVQALSRSSKH
jgi:hypothetical protein